MTNDNRAKNFSIVQVTKRALLVYFEASICAKIERNFSAVACQSKMNANSGSRPQDMAGCLWDDTYTLQEIKDTTSNNLMLYTDIHNANEHM